MAFKDILLTLTSYPDPTPASVAEDAVAIAATFGAHLAAVACEVHVEVPGHFLSGSTANIPGIIAGETEKSRKSARDMLAAFDAAAEKAGILHETQLEKCPTFAVPDLLVDHARLRDLTIVPVPESYDQWYAEAVIFGSGRPTLVLPESPRARPFELGTVAVAWDFSRAAARAVSDAMPLLEKAKKVRIVTVINEKKLDSKHSAEALAKNLARHGIDVVLDKVDARRPADRRGARSLHRFASGRRSRDGRLWPRAMARVHPRRRHQEPAVEAAAPDPVLALTAAIGMSARREIQMAEDINRDNSRPPLKVRRVNLDTGRENVVVISRHSSALRPDIFRGFSRVELRAWLESAARHAADHGRRRAWSGPMKSGSPSRHSAASPSRSAAW